MDILSKKLNIDNYDNMLKDSDILYYEKYKDGKYKSFMPYKEPESFINPVIKEWTYTALVTDCSDYENITISAIDIETGEPVYKLIPKNKIDFTCSENDYILINIKEFADYNKPRFVYNIYQYNPLKNQKLKQQIIESMKQTKNDKDII